MVFSPSIAIQTPQKKNTPLVDELLAQHTTDPNNTTDDSDDSAIRRLEELIDELEGIPDMADTEMKELPAPDELDELTAPAPAVDHSPIIIDPKTVDPKLAEQFLLWDKAILGEKQGAPSSGQKKALQPIPKKPSKTETDEMQNRGIQKATLITDTALKTSVIEKPAAQNTSAPSLTVPTKLPPRKPVVGNSTDGSPLPNSQYSGLLATIMRNHGMDEKKWDAVKDRPVADVLREEGNDSFKQYMEELQKKQEAGKALPQTGELVWQYVERLLPRER